MTPFSEKVAAELLASHPEWRVHVREEVSETGSTYLVVQVPAPPEADTVHGLVITTDDEEITVSFDYYHAHYGNWLPTVPDETHDAALPFVESILSEQIAVVSEWLDGKWCGSGPVERGESNELSSTTNRDHVRVRSWLGTRNADRDA